MSVLAQRLLALHDALTEAELSHAFGGAIALAYCTGEPRGTRDLDVNVFVAPSRAGEVFSRLPDGVRSGAGDLEAAERDGQVRLWWEDTPIDIFLNVHRFHDEVAHSVRWVPFSERMVPVVGCTTLAVFKVLLNRTKDWADIEAMVQEGTLDVAGAAGWLQSIIGDGDAVRRLTLLEDA